MKKQNKGITLIALVITIIVLLILAGVSIATLTGENGILTQAQNAKVSNKKAEAEEEMALIASEWAIEKYTGNKTLEEFLNEKLKEGKLDSIEKNEDGTYTIKVGNFQKTINQDGEIIPTFDAEEWDKTALDEDYFIWESDIEGDQGYGTIIGYKQQIENCTLLRYPSRCKKITFSNNLNYEGITTDSSRTFTNNIVKIEIPSTVKEIGYGAYGFDTNTFAALKEVVIEYGLSKIGGSAFYNCTNLETIEIPDSVICVEGRAFYGTKWYENQTDGLVYLGKVAYKFFGEMPTETEIVLLDGTTEIADGAFENCSNLINIVIPDSVTDIKSSAFEGCYNLNTLELPKSLKNIGTHAFYGCAKIQNVEIPYGVTIISQGAFASCSELSNIIIPDSVQIISHYAFGWCEKLNNVIIPDSVTEMYGQVFDSCINLESVELSNNITEIAYTTFANCEKLNNIVIPNRITEIRMEAFNGCRSLTDVYYEGTEEEWNNITIESANEYLINANIHYNQ